jgi:DNA polymerase-4
MPLLLRAGPEALGRRLQEDVAREVHLPVSVGLGANRMLAKVASAAAKPGGVRWIPPQQTAAYLAELPVEKLPGVGPRTREQLADMNVHTVADLRRIGRGLLAGLFGRRGEVLYERCRGREPQPLRPDAPPRSISRETTFHRPTCDAREVRGMLAYLLQRAMRTARQADLLAGCVELSVRYEDGKPYAARRTLDEPTDEDAPAFSAVEALLERLHTRRVALRNVGVVLSGFRHRGQRGELFTPAARRRRRHLHAAVDAIRDRWGHQAIVSGRAIDLLGHLEQNDAGFVLRTPSLTK